MKFHASRAHERFLRGKTTAEKVAIHGRVFERFPLEDRYR